MAWDVQYVSNLPNPVSSDLSKEEMLKWGTFTVFDLQFDFSINTVNIRLDSTSIGGWGYYYVCVNEDDFKYSSNNPDYYEFMGYMGESAKKLDLRDLYSSQNHIYIVICPSSENNQGFGRLSITIDDSGGGDDPYYTASGNNADKTITINLRNYSSISSSNYFLYYIDDSNGNRYRQGVMTTGTVTESGLIDDTYEVKVMHRHDGIEEQISALVDGYYQSSAYVEIKSSANIYFTASGNNTNKTITIDLYNYSSILSGYFLFYIYYSDDSEYTRGPITDGTVTQSIQNDDTYKVVVEYRHDGTREYISALVDGQYQSAAYIKIESPETWHYDYIGERNVSLSGGKYEFTYNIGPGSNKVNYGIYAKLNFPNTSAAKFTIKLSNLDGAIAYLVSRDVYSYNGYVGYNPNNGIPYTSSMGNTASSFIERDFSIMSGVPYYLWVCGSSNSVSGYVTITITLSINWEEKYEGDVIVANLVRDIAVPLAGRTTHRYHLTFNESGKATFYSKGDVDLVAYIGLHNNGIRESDGVPNSFVESWNDSSLSSGNYRGTYNVTANTQYYFYVKSKTGASSATVYIYFAPQSALTDRGFWIGTSLGEWQKLTVYIGNASRQWVEYKPYIAIDEQNPYWIDEY